MGEYIYKVTAKTKTLKDGTKANIAVFAYKPSWEIKRNKQMAKNSGCPQAEYYVANSKNYTGLVVLGEDGDFAIPVKHGTFSDGWFGLQISKMNKE